MFSSTLILLRVIHFQVALLDSQLSYSSVSVEIRGPDNKVYKLRNLNKGHGTFVPSKIGVYEIIVNYNGDEVLGGNHFRVLPALVEVAPPGMSPCALGSLVQVLVNTTGHPKREDISVTAYSPSGRPLNCPLTTIDETNSATFKPDEPGEWRIEITYQGKQIQLNISTIRKIVNEEDDKEFPSIGRPKKVVAFEN